MIYWGHVIFRLFILTTSEAVLGLAPSGEPPSSLEQSGPASSSYSVKQSDSSPVIGSIKVQVRYMGLRWYFQLHMPPISRPSTPNSQGSLQPLTIGTAIRDVACWWLNPGHNLSQVSKARTWEGKYLWGEVRWGG